MKNFVKLIEEKISNELKPEKIKIIDNSYLHQKHKFFDPDKKHLKLIISSKKLKSMKRTEAHKVIFSIIKGISYISDEVTLKMKFCRNHI